MTPRWFVQTSDGALWAYFTPEPLRFDLRVNKDEEVKVYEIDTKSNPGKTRYLPVTRESVLAQIEDGA